MYVFKKRDTLGTQTQTQTQTQTPPKHIHVFKKKRDTLGTQRSKFAKFLTNLGRDRK